MVCLTEIRYSVSNGGILWAERILLRGINRLMLPRLGASTYTPRVFLTRTPALTKRRYPQGFSWDFHNGN
jgi:hypothetical protein